uniref:Uncharacterized protein n=1 Tax=Anguilla anguilla TaxID=7936 RepID=A0A0E9UB65_ANGAN
MVSISSGRWVTLCMGRIRKEIMGRLRQSWWLSIRVRTSLKDGFLVTSLCSVRC